MRLFYDTNVLLDSQKEIFESSDKFFISSITLNELESIKSSGHKDEETKYKARKVLHLLEENEDKYQIILFKQKYIEGIEHLGLPDTADTKIIATAHYLFTEEGIADGVFCTKDLACKAIARSIGLNVNYKKEVCDDYFGYTEIICSDLLLNDFYSNYVPNGINNFNLLENQYLIIRDKENKVIDKYRWYENGYHQVQFQKIESRMFGKVSPKDGDIYQLLAMDSLKNNQITLLGGPAGSGKTMLSLGYLFQELEHGRIDKIIIFCNPVVAKNAAKLGFYPGTRLEKLLSTQVGMVLASKLGSPIEVEKLIEDDVLDIIPVGDARGYETPPYSGVYILESQNLDIELLKLLLQRVSDSCKVIVDGDYNAQTDMSMYAGSNNGMRRMSEVFRGNSLYGQVNLKNIYRSKIGDIADRM